MFTNRKEAKIIVEKQTLPDADPQKFGFEGDLQGSIGDGEKIARYVDPGTYSTTETVPAGLLLTDITCGTGGSGNKATAKATYVAGPGEVVKCVFTNTKNGKIIVEKQTLPDGDPEQFTYTGALAGSIGDGGTIEVAVAPGTYTTTETVPAGWALTSIVCGDADSSGDKTTGVATYKVAPGETV